MIAIPAHLSPADLVEPGPSEARREFSGETMGTTWSAALYAGQTLPDELFLRRIQWTLEGVVSQMSHWRPDSALSEYNRAPAGRWQVLPDEFRCVLESALEIARLSEGAFDPSLGEAADQWGFGPSGPRGSPPLAAELVPPLHDWRHIELDPKAGRALQPGEVRLDFSSIAKGFAVDLLAALLEQLGASSYLVEIGGELRARGVKAGGQPWWVWIEPPPGCPLKAKVALCGKAVATSGDYRFRFEHEGTSYAHTLDPRTRAPLINPPSSVTVVHDRCMDADAWSTALMVLGVDSGLALCARHEIAALFLVRESGGWRAVASPAFGAMLV